MEVRWGLMEVGLNGGGLMGLMEVGLNVGLSLSDLLARVQFV